MSRYYSVPEPVHSLTCIITHQDEEEEKFQDLRDDDDDEEERFVDADKIEEGQSVKPQQNKPAASWVHHQNFEGNCDMTYHAVIYYYYYFSFCLFPYIHCFLLFRF